MDTDRDMKIFTPKPAGEPLTPESASVDDPGPIPRAKLQEMRACLADCLSIVNQALGLEG